VFSTVIPWVWMTPLARTLERLMHSQDFVNLRAIPGVRVELKYASNDNFMGKNVYGEFTEPFLHETAAEKLRRAIERLHSEKPGCSLLVFDALRPRTVQRLLWDHVKDTPNEIYVANPDRGSMHNYGCAIDLTIADDRGQELDMGTPFDTFHPLSQPQLEEEHRRAGLLKTEHIENRLLLRRSMTGAGFAQLPHEWWHYDAFPGEEVRRRFQIIE
jgi:zinc D-Ala-D-Ala dipeptidase